MTEQSALPPSTQRILAALVAAHPQRVSAAELARRGRISPRSSTLSYGVSLLRARGLVEGGPREGYVATELAVRSGA